MLPTAFNNLLWSVSLSGLPALISALASPTISTSSLIIFNTEKGLKVCFSTWYNLLSGIMSFQPKPTDSIIVLTSHPAKQLNSILSPSPCFIPSELLLSSCAGQRQLYCPSPDSRTPSKWFTTSCIRMAHPRPQRQH